ncbi:MAG: ATP-binding protein [Nitriliruptoraceae bacterium]
MRRVLIVDDNADNRYFLASLLTSHGDEVIVANNGEEALALARATPPELCVSDLLMPVMDGYTLLRKWRADETLADVPFVVYTATYTDPGDRRLALRLGADGFVLKPAEPDELLRQLDQAIDRRRSDAASQQHAKSARREVASETEVLEAYNAALVRKLEQKMLQLEAANEELKAGLDERRHAAERLQRALEIERVANEQLRAVERMRLNFLRAVSHELRTPLTSVLGISESLQHRDGDFDDEMRMELTGRLAVNAQRLSRLLEDLLDLNRLLSGRVEFGSESFELRSIVDEAVDDVDVDGRPLTIDVAPGTIEGDRVRLVRAVANLLRNAVVHTPPGTPIAIKAGGDGSRMEIRVIDQGDGVPDELSNRVFEPFEQGPSAPMHQPGTGIGLSLVREFVALQGGTVHVEQTPGGGATFVVTMPVKDSEGQHAVDG